MSGNGSTGLGGTLAGALGAGAREVQHMDRRTRHAESTAEDADRTAQTALNRALPSGDKVRLTDDQCRDFNLGLAYPDEIPGVQAGPLAGIPEPLRRPIVTESMVRSFGAWPGNTNNYDDRGNLKDKNRAMDGERFLTALSLGFPEVRAVLAALQIPAVDPTPDQVAGLFRVFRALSTLTADPAAAIPGLSDAGMLAAWERFFAVPVSGVPSLVEQRLDFFTDPKNIVSNTTAETEIARLAVPKNSLVAVGDRLLTEYEYSVLAQNSTNTHQFQVRLDSLSGAVLFNSSALNLPASQGFIRMAAIYRGLVAGVPTLGLGGQMVSGVNVGMTGPAAAGVTFDPTIDHVLILTATQSAASTGNQAQAQYGYARSQRVQ